MITENSDKSIDVDYDIFSFTGRAALLGGGAYAIHKSIKNNEFKYKRDLTHRSRENPHIQSVKESQRKDLVNSLANTQTETEKAAAKLTEELAGLKPSSAFGKLIPAANNGFERMSFSDLFDPKTGLNRFSGGYEGRSKGMPQEFKRLLNSVQQVDGHYPSFEVKFDKLQKVSELRVLGEKTTVHLKLSDEFGFSGDSVLRPSWKYGTNGAIDIVGSDVVSTSFYADNFGKFNDGSISMKEFKEAERANSLYSDKGYNTGIDPKRANPEQIKQIQESPKYDFSDKFRGGKAKSQSVINDVIFEHNIKYPGTSASDLANGILATAEAPTNDQRLHPFLNLTNNPKQGIREMASKARNGELQYRTNKNILFIDDKIYEEIRKANPHFGELATEEGLVIGEKADTLVDRTRSITIQSEQIGDSADHIMKEMSRVSGLSEDAIALTIQKSGFDSFEEVHQKAFRRISVNSYSEHIKEELRKSAQRRKSLMKTNASIQTVEEAKELNLLNESIPQLHQKLKRSNIFGASSDGLGVERLTKEYKEGYLDNLIYNEKNKSLTFQVARKRKVGAGTKIMDESGEAKVIIKGTIDEGKHTLIAAYMQYIKREEKLSIAEKRAPKHRYDEKTLKTILETDLILPESARKGNIYLRNANSSYFSIKEKAKIDGNKRILDIFSSHEASIETMSEPERMDLWNKLDAEAGKQGFKDILDKNGKVKRSRMDQLATENVGIGEMVRKRIAYGSLPEDMGYGKDMFFAERHINHLHALGLGSYVDEIKEQRHNVQAAKSYYEFSNDQARLMAKGGKVDFSIQDIKHSSFLEGVFPKLKNEKGNLDNTGLIARKNYLAKRGIEGTAFVSLGETVEGIDKIAIYNTEHLVGQVGKKIGSYDKYSELDKTIRDILLMANNPNRDQKNYERLIRNYLTTTEQLKSTLTKNLDKGKSGSGLTLRVTSGREGMEAYAEKMFSKTNNPLNLLAAISEENYIKYYGQEAFDYFKETGFSRSWAVGIREPVEGSSALALNIIPSKDVLEDEVSMLTKHKPKDNIWSILKAVFGDTDGDAITLGFAKDGGKASAAIQELAIGNKAKSIAFRRSHELKMKISLKGLEQKTLLENLNVDFTGAKIGLTHAKVLEKQAVAIVSESLKPLHSLNAQKYAGDTMTDLDFKKYMSNETFMHTFTENVLKGKFQSFEQLETKHSMYTLSALLGTEEFMNASITDRMKNLRDFTDGLVFGNNKDIAAKIRAGEDISSYAKEMGEVDIKAWQEMTADETLRNIAELADEAKRKTNTVVDAASLAAEDLKGIKNEINLMEEAAETSKDIKQMFSGVGSNMLKYAIIPATVFGVLGTVFNSKSRISQEGEYSDTKGRHDDTSGKDYGFSLAPNIDRPKYMKPTVTGSARSGFNIDKYSAGQKGGQMRVTDHTRSFDHLDMEDKMRRGY